MENLIESIEKIVSDHMLGKIHMSYMKNGKKNSYTFRITKKNSRMHNVMKKNKISNSEHNEIIYENTYEKFLEILNSNFESDIDMGLVIRIYLDTGYHKVYGFFISCTEENKFMQLNAKELVESYSVDYRTGEKLEPFIKDIYCGAEEDDVICGFDLK